MRWLLLLLVVPSFVVADDLDGVWSSPESAEAGAVNRVVIVDAWDRIFFRYVSDAGHRCEVFGIARRSSSKADAPYVYKNDAEHNFYSSHESYGSEENRDCEVSFETLFSGEGRILRVSSSGNCRSFCGLNGTIGGELHKVPDEHSTERGDSD